MKEEIRKHYREKREEIKNRIKDFRDLREAGNERLFTELVFVILTSQSPAKECWEAVQELEEKGLLENPVKEEISEILAGHDVQYEDRKSSYIADNRKKLSQPTLENPGGGLKLRERIEPENLDSTREWLVDEVKGMGWKGASHFLRNVGYGNSFAIISSHIVRKLTQFNIIEDRPSNREEYLEAEEKLEELSRELEIPVQQLDLVLWSMETGEIFK